MNNLILIGMMGCGKSTVGRLAAEKLGLAFVDTDERIEAEAGRTIPELFDAEGEEGFRARELDVSRALAREGGLVIACGGGGIPVIATDHHHLKGAAAVIDKDLASELLAEHLDADMLIILTAVEKVAVNFNKPNQKWLDALTPEEARTYIGEGQFAPGSMLPKVEAAVKFAESKPGRTALITLLEKARDGIDGKTGTRITC